MMLVMEHVAFAHSFLILTLNESDWPSQEQAVRGAVETRSVKQALPGSEGPKRMGEGGLRKPSSAGEE